MSTGLATCPCLTSPPTTLPNGGTVLLAAQTYDYASTYGLNKCDVHDATLAPYCSGLVPPEWCASTWCYVESANCDGLITTDSVFFPGLSYSYSTCGDANTFDSWFVRNEGDHESLADLTTLVSGYLESMVTVLEDSYDEITGAASCEIETSCSCDGCTRLSDLGYATPDWCKTECELSFSHATTTLRTAADYGGAQGTMEKCLSSIVGSSFQRIAAKEASTSRVGSAYGAFQHLGTYMQWPGLEWCPATYDPRYRPWYAAAAAGPKDVVVVVDVSGSMTGTRIGMARDAAKAVLNTLTETDYASVIVFWSGVDAYSTTLVQATEENKELMESWINSNVLAGGGTDFNAALSKAKEVLNNGGGTGCNKVVLFMSDGEPEEAPDMGALTRDLDAIGNVRLMTYALGNGAQADVLKSMACENGGVFQAVPDDGDLAYAMAMYYQVLAPSLAPCQTRYTEYTDLVSGKKLLAACTPAYEKTSSAAENSCNGGLGGLGDSGSSVVAQLLGVVCMDMDMIVPLDVLKAHSGYAQFEAAVDGAKARCSRVIVSEAQLETIRAKVSRDSVCDWAAYSARPTPMSTPSPSPPQRMSPTGASDADEMLGPIVGGAIGGVALLGIVVVVVVIICCCKKKASPPTTAAAEMVKPQMVAVDSIPMGTPVA